jgi:hypothetical protein
LVLPGDTGILSAFRFDQVEPSVFQHGDKVWFVVPQIGDRIGILNGELETGWELGELGYIVRMLRTS